MAATAGESDINAGIHALNFVAMVLFYHLFRYCVKREGTVPDDDEENPSSSSATQFKLPDPEYERGASLHFVGIITLIAGAPSLFYCVFYTIFRPITEGDPVRAEMAPQYNKNAFLRQQLVISLFVVVHVLLRLSAHSSAKKRQEHASSVVEQMRLKGHERVLVVRCGKGEWVNAIAKMMERGGKVTGVDDWLSKECKCDSAWAIENARREGVEKSVIIEEEPKDVVNLDMKNECVDVVVIPFDEEANEPRFFQSLCEMNRLLKPGGKLISVQHFAEPTIMEDMLEEIKYTNTRRAYIRTGYNMHKVVVGIKPDDAGFLHSHDGLGAETGINMVDSDYLNESPGMAGLGLSVMMVFLTCVGLYGVAMLNTFIYFEWEAFNIPKEFQIHNRLNTGILQQLSIWCAYGFIAVWFELKQRSKFTIRRVGVVKIWFLYCIQYVGGGMCWVFCSFAVRIWLREYGLTLQMMMAWVMVLPTGVFVYVAAKIRIFETMSAWRQKFGIRPDGAPSRLKQFCESDEFNGFMMMTILLAGALVGCSTDKALAQDELLKTLERLVLFIFIIEFLMKFFGDWPKPWLYFMDWWNVFDFSIVAVGVINLIISSISGSGGADFVMVIRLFRLARVFKMFRQIQQLRIVVSTLFVVLPGVLYVMVVMFMLLYMFAVLGTFLFGANDPVFFGDLGRSGLSCMAIMTRRWIKYFEINFYGCAEYYPVYSPNHLPECDPAVGPNWVMAMGFFSVILLVMSYMFLNTIVGMVIVQIEPATAQVKREDWEAAEAEEEGAGGIPEPEVKALLSRLATHKQLQKMVQESQAYRQDIQRLRRMILYIRPRQPQQAIV